MGPLPSYAESSQVRTQYSSRGQPQYKSQGQSPTGMPNASRSGLSSPTRTIGSVPMLLFIALTCLVILAACGSTQSYPPSAGGTQTQPKPGTIILFSIPTAVSQPWGIVMATDGNLWFTELQSNKIGRITPGGKITEFPLSPLLVVLLISRQARSATSGSPRTLRTRSDRSRSVVR